MHVYIRPELFLIQDQPRVATAAFQRRPVQDKSARNATLIIPKPYWNTFESNERTRFYWRLGAVLALTVPQKRIAQ